ncbi:hypothetical protein ACOKFD_16905 [Flagellimonas sp. S174]|uniref:hypothetical protein n=1 Tax=Flagellimonas sp. S174 TaxID=3410790 RepID=UPI003BF53941
MINLNEIDEFHRKGRGKVFQFYITDDELKEVLDRINKKRYGILSLIVIIENESCDYNYLEYPLEYFWKDKPQNVNTFFIRDKKLTPNIDLPKDSEDLSKYYMYNGLIRISHGGQRKGYQQQSNIMFVDSYFRIVNPTEVYENKEYSRLFGTLKKEINFFLKFKGNHIGKSGKIYESKTKNVSEGFALNLSKGLLKAPIQIE